MKNVVVVGSLWGDEGNGKVVDNLANDLDAAVRYQGGHNAGHTLIVNGKKIVFFVLTIFLALIESFFASTNHCSVKYGSIIELDLSP